MKSDTVAKIAKALDVIPFLINPLSFKPFLPLFLKTKVLFLREGFLSDGITIEDLVKQKKMRKLVRKSIIME